MVLDLKITFKGFFYKILTNFPPTLVGIMWSDTWLEDSVLNVQIQMSYYDVFRADRDGRKSGGVAVFFRSELQCKVELIYANSVVKALVIKCKKLNTFFV